MDPTDTPENSVGKRTRRLREERGWTQGDLGRRMASHGFEMHQTTVAKLESGTRPIRLNETAALAEVFGVPITDLFGDPDDPFGLNDDEAAVRLRQIRLLQVQVFDAEAAAQEAHADMAAATARARALDLRATDLAQRLASAEQAFRESFRG